MKVIQITGNMPPCCCGQSTSGCGCPGVDSADDLTLTISSDDCSSIDGITLTLQWDGAQWTGLLSDNYCLYGAAALWCDAENATGSCADYALSIGFTVSGCPITPVLPKHPDRCSCDPLSLEYDYIMSESAPGVCPCGCETFPASLTIKVVKAE